jgi:hypothetical protein
MMTDWTGETPYPLTRHRELHEHSRRRHTHALTTFGNGVVLADRERDGVDARAAPVADFDRPMFGEPVRPHRAPWTEHERADATVTYRLSGADAYARAVPLPFVPVEAIHDDAAVSATLDRDTGRLVRVVDDRRLDVDVGVDRRDVRTVRMRLRTEVDRYGDVSAPRPSGEFGGGPSGSVLDGADLTDRLAALASDLGTY